MFRIYFHFQTALELVFALTVILSNQNGRVIPILQTSALNIISKKHAAISNGNNNKSFVNRKPDISHFFDDLGIFENNRLLQKSVELVNKYGFLQNLSYDGSTGYDISHMYATKIPLMSYKRKYFLGYSSKLGLCDCPDCHCKVENLLKLMDDVLNSKNQRSSGTKVSWLRVKDKEKRRSESTFGHKEKQEFDTEGTNVSNAILSYCNEILGRRMSSATYPYGKSSRNVTRMKNIANFNKPKFDETENRTYPETISSSPLPDLQTSVSTERPKQDLPYLKPTIECTSYNKIRKFCSLTKQLGDTAVLSVKITGVIEKGAKFQIIWKKSLKTFSDNNKIMETLESATKSGNVQKLDYGRELKIKPVMDDDVHYNSFKAILKQSLRVSDESVFVVISNMTFFINIRPFDMGRVYVNEVTRIDIDHYFALSHSSFFHFFWGIENSFNKDVLPLKHNMIAKRDGLSLFVTHIREETSHIIVCTICTPDGNFRSKRRFFFHKPVLL